MSIAVKVKVCADCFKVQMGQAEVSQIGPDRIQGISRAFGRWEDYTFRAVECSYVDFLEVTTCGICGQSLTNDRRQHNDQRFARDRRKASCLDRRSPMNRGCGVLYASLKVA